MDKSKFHTVLCAVISSAEHLRAEGEIIPKGTARTLNRLAANVGELKLDMIKSGGEQSLTIRAITGRNGWLF